MTELAIQALNLCKDFGHVKAVQSLNLEIPRSRIYGFLGPQRIGEKPLPFACCAACSHPPPVRSDVLGYSIPDEAEALRVKVGYMTQKFSLFEDLTVAENLQFMADIYTLERKLKKQRIELCNRTLSFKQLSQAKGRHTQWWPKTTPGTGSVHITRTGIAIPG